MAKSDSKLSKANKTKGNMSILKEYAYAETLVHYGLSKTLSDEGRRQVVGEFMGYGDATKGTRRDMFGNKQGTPEYRRDSSEYLGGSGYDKATKTIKVKMTPEDVQGAIAKYNTATYKVWNDMYLHEMNRKTPLEKSRGYKQIVNNKKTIKKSAEMTKHYDTYRTAVYNIARYEWSQKSGKKSYTKLTSKDIKKYRKDYTTSKAWINKNKFETDITKYVDTSDFKFIR